MTAPTIGQPLPRIDGRAKVTGAARYAADFNQAGQAYAVIVGSEIGLGSVTSIDADPVLRMPGILAVIGSSGVPGVDGPSASANVASTASNHLHVLRDNNVRYHGQPVVVVVADSPERAEHAAATLRITYTARRPVVELIDPDAAVTVPERARRRMEIRRGDADAAFARSSVTLSARYEIAREVHNPMEPPATVAAWDGDHLTLWSKSQFVLNERDEIAAFFGLRPDDVLVICPFIGGAFGSAIRTWPHVALAALAARIVDRPVKLVLSRRQMSQLTGYRPRTTQHVALGSDASGRLTSLIHEGAAETSRDDDYVEPVTTLSTILYSCPNVRTRYGIVPLDVGSPTWMRGPGKASGLFALESAMDELADAHRMDPVLLRQRNEPDVDQAEGRPFSSRALLECYRVGASRFEWTRRTPEPRSMRDGSLLIGLGMAAAAYPVNLSAAKARVRLHADGTVSVEVASSDMGPGTTTSMAQVAADALQLPIRRVRTSIGRSDLPSAPDHAGSQTMASIGSAVHAACLVARDAVAGCATGDPRFALFGAPADEIEWVEGRLRRVGRRPETGVDYRQIVQGSGRPWIEAEGSFTPDDGVAQELSMYAFGAVFAEVAVDPDLGTVRVRRMVGSYAAGRIVNPRLAASQCISGMVGGIGMALMERAVLDPRDGRPVNGHLADYLVPANLDVPGLQACFVEEDDPNVNVLGVKGIGEIAIIGVAPAIANAVFHATGTRTRELPIRIEHVLAGSARAGDPDPRASTC